MIQENTPDEFIRGIANKDFVQNGHVLPSAFQFDEADRADGKHEASINWMDDVEAIHIALNQRKVNGKLQFVGGVAKLNKSKVNLMLASIEQGMFSYERRALDNNPYHGNLLLSGDISKPMKQMVMSALALAAGTNIIEQNNVE